MFTITLQHMKYEVNQQLTLMQHPLAFGEDGLPNTKLVLTVNGKGLRDFRLTHYKRSDDSHLRDEQQLLYLTTV
ncbi:hypothetical protein TNCV_2348821 [Trichonephila clavipes]|uniref:Uncharacterized protein n=1 Tax=Trichonephila clavipes TaxID=2585209 RepID=A0A8X6VF55_TRICX|nr:hypothetical protein TNCV_2348821 [Trichonephila clavipes]